MSKRPKKKKRRREKTEKENAASQTIYTMLPKVLGYHFGIGIFFPGGLTGPLCSVGGNVYAPA